MGHNSSSYCWGLSGKGGRREPGLVGSGVLLTCEEPVAEQAFKVCSQSSLEFDSS